MRYRNDVIRSVRLLHIRAYLGMMLARDYASCRVARSTLVMIVTNNVQNLRWPANLKHKVRAQPLELNLKGAHALFITCMWPFHNVQYIHIYTFYQ